MIFKMQPNLKVSKKILKDEFLKTVPADLAKIIFDMQGSFDIKFPRLSFL